MRIGIIEQWKCKRGYMDNRFENLREKNYKLSQNIKSSLNKLEDMEKKHIELLILLQMYLFI